ncbi:hypothetical protein [Paenibacillus wynnii]|uniref:hypothetical protein n=1 Tax=Paenibacillus wynnii TaxID=268407 RepID=UPI0012FACFB7|nr:hypothetical protein [Paenibacillus wynnii]
MPNLIPLTTSEATSYPSRAAGRTAAKNRRTMIKSAIWPFAKASVVLLGLFVKEVFL